MAKSVQFINPFTDFGFKKLFGEEGNKDLLKNLPDLEEVPELFQKGILAKVFKVADMDNLTREERRAYEESVKQYRDLKNVTDTAFYDGKIEGKMEEKEDIILNGHEQGFSADSLAKLTKLTVTEVLKIIQRGSN